MSETKSVWHKTLPIQVPWRYVMFNCSADILCPGNQSPWVMARVEAGAQDQAEAYAALMTAAPALYDALSGAISLLEMASINSDAFGGEDDPEYIASKAAWDRDLDSFRSALLLANTGGTENG